MITLMRGNTYDLPITLKVGGAIILDTDVKKVEFIFGTITKTFPENVTFENNAFIVHLTQEDTLALNATLHEQHQCRVLFNNGKAKATKRDRLVICDTEAKGVLL